MSYTINSKIEIEIEGRDIHGFDVSKRSTDILFDNSDRVIDADAMAIRIMKAITSLKSKSTVTIWLYKGESKKVVESLRWTYEGYNGHEWMRRKLADGCFEVTEDFVKNKDIKKDIIRLVDNMNLISYLQKVDELI